MILILFGAICLVALVLIIIGLTRPSESAQAIVGFVLLFLLAIILLNGNVEIEKGANTNTTYGYDSVNRVNFTQQNIVYSYDNFNDSTSRQMGMYLAIACVVGTFGIIISLRRRRDE